jgi:hypothetical protein
MIRPVVPGATAAISDRALPCGVIRRASQSIPVPGGIRTVGVGPGRAAPMGVWRPGWATSPAANEVWFPADRALTVGCAQFGVATVGRGRVLWTIDDVFFVVGSNARGSRSQPCPGTTVTLLRSVPAVGLGPVPDVGLRPVPAVGLRPVPAVGLTPVPAVELRPLLAVGLTPVPAVGLRSVPVVVRPSTSLAAPGTTDGRLLGCPVWATCARSWPRLRLRRTRSGRLLLRLLLLRLGARRLLLRLLLGKLLLRLARRPGVTIGGRQSFGPHRPELAQPLFGGKIGAIVRLLAIVPPPAHRLPPHRVPRSSLASRTDPGAPQAPAYRPTIACQRGCRNPSSSPDRSRQQGSGLGIQPTGGPSDGTQIRFRIPC